jgi:hypothetical protein
MRFLVFAFILINSAICNSQLAEFSIETPLYKSEKVVEGTPVLHAFIVKNTGTAPLVISNYKVACACTKITYPKSIAVGATDTIKLSFDTNGKYYQQDRNILLFTNTKKGQETLRFKVFVIPKDEQ